MESKLSGKHFIYFIDEDQDALDTYVQLLNSAFQRATPPDVQFEAKGVLVRAHLEDYFDIIKDTKTSSIIIDQRLKETGVANYTGIELALYFRNIGLNLLPIYILTSYEGDAEFKVGEWSVEDILSKTDIADRIDVVAIRLLRRISNYRELLDERASMYQSLLKKSLEGQLDEADAALLKELQFQRTASILAEEALTLGQIRGAVAEIQKLNQELEQLEAEKDELDKSEND